MCVDSYVIQLVTRLPIMNMAKLLILISFAFIATFLAFECNAALFFYHVKPCWERLVSKINFLKLVHPIDDLFSRKLLNRMKVKSEIQTIPMPKMDFVPWKYIYPFWYQAKRSLLVEQ